MKQAMLKALKSSFGIVAKASEQAGINRTTHYLWLEKDKDYAKQIRDLKEYKKDFIESKLLNLISNGDTAATIFAAKTQLKDRGYVERTELTGENGKDLGTMIPVINLNVVQPPKDEED